MFQSTRIKLTAWYLLMIMIVSLFFSTTIYRAISFEFERFEKNQQKRMEKRLREMNDMTPPRGPFGQALPPPTPELLEEARERVLIILIGINSGIFIIAGGMGYFLAGRTLRPIKDMVEEQNRFISDASHELKTPLTSLRTSFEVYLRERNPKKEETTMLIKDSLADVQRLQALSESLLQITQFENSQTPIQKTTLDLRMIVTEAIRILQPLSKDKAITIHDLSSAAFIVGEKQSLTQLITILLENAIKYSPPHSSIKIDSVMHATSIMLTITDHGIGIASDDLPHIFDRFYRADKARLHNGGYGLGLAIAKQIVSFHQGSISAESNLAKGTTFTVSLPRASHQKNSTAAII